MFSGKLPASVLCFLGFPFCSPSTFWKVFSENSLLQRCKRKPNERTMSILGSRAEPLQAKCWGPGGPGAPDQEKEFWGRAPLGSELHLLSGSTFTGSLVWFHQEGVYSHQHEGQMTLAFFEHQAREETPSGHMAGDGGLGSWAPRGPSWGGPGGRHLLPTLVASPPAPHPATAQPCPAGRNQAMGDFSPGEMVQVGREWKRGGQRLGSSWGRANCNCLFDAFLREHIQQGRERGAPHPLGDHRLMCRRPSGGKVASPHSGFRSWEESRFHHSPPGSIGA